MDKLAGIHKVMARADRLFWDIQGVAIKISFSSKRRNYKSKHLAMIHLSFIPLRLPPRSSIGEKDLSLYKEDLSLAFNGEFKKGGITQTSKSVESTILKDFEKLQEVSLFQRDTTKPLETFNHCIVHQTKP